MRNNSIRIVKATTSHSDMTTGYDYSHSYMHGYTLDLSKRTAVLMRQSRKGADESHPESRLRQEGLVRVAVEIRADHDSLMIIPCDEGSGVSGQKKIYERPKLLQLWDGIQDGTIGSVVVAREDRLFRDRFLTQVTQFAEECANRGVLLIVAGRRCYDFTSNDDFKAFIGKMQESYGYIDTHIRYMAEIRAQKHQRGEWIGSALAAPYVLDRLVIQVAREQRKALKEFGGDREEEAMITKAFRPVIYQPWHPIAVELFQTFKMFNFSRARLGRYIEEQKCVFPLPSLEDAKTYIFKTNMKLVTGRGYTFSDSTCLGRWMTNLVHLGFASAGFDEDGNRIFIEGAFEAAVSRDLFEECYEAITGYTLDGELSQTSVNHSRFTRKHPRGQAQALLTKCFDSPDGLLSFTARRDTTSRDYYIARAKRIVSDDEVSVSIWDANAIWALQVKPIDRAIVNRLAQLAEHDKNLATRVEQFYAELSQSKTSEKKSIIQEIGNLTALIDRYDQLLTNPAQPLSTAQEKRYLESQAAAELELEKAQRAFKKYEATRSDQFIPAFYRILGEAPSEFWGLGIDRQRRMLRLLVDRIEVENISPHVYSLRLKWKDPVAQPWDCALIFRRNALRSNSKAKEWSEEEIQHLGEIYPTTNGLDLSIAFPMKSGGAIRQKASDLKVKRDASIPRTYSTLSRSLCYADWVNTCTALHVARESEEGNAILKQLNYLAQTTESKGMIFWWLLPLVEMSNFEQVWPNPSQSNDLPPSALCD